MKGRGDEQVIENEEEMLAARIKVHTYKLTDDF